MFAAAAWMYNHRGRNMDPDRSKQHSKPSVFEQSISSISGRLVTLRLSDHRRLLTYCGRRRRHGDRIHRLLRNIASQRVSANHGSWMTVFLSSWQIVIVIWLSFCSV